MKQKNTFNIILSLLTLAFFTVSSFFLSGCCDCSNNNGSRVTANERRVSSYFERIRDNTALLTAFFNEMPKGGDLHNHLTGSVYAETYIDYVIEKDYCINTLTLEVRDAKQAGKEWATFSELQKEGTLPQYKEKLLQKWSVKDYNHVSYPSDKLFFETFPSFNIATKGEGRTDSFLYELKRRAKEEHISYIELMTVINGSAIKDVDTSYNSKLEMARMTRDTAMLYLILDTMYAGLHQDVEQYADTFCKKFTLHHRQLMIDDSSFTMRYLFCAVRVVPPASFFKNLVVSFVCAADTTSPVVGVNILAPEDNDVSMRDYWLHMQMFRYLHRKESLRKVKYSMHAGELALGMVKPEEMTCHISDAVYTAGAGRIGHGVDIPYENHVYDLLRYMSKNKIAVEINLSSNEFILQVKEDMHPISLYKQFGVPMVISTDDAGVLRTNMVYQYVLLAKRYKQVSYHDIKTFVHNSITYSFIRENDVRQKLLADIDKQFAAFENQVIEVGNN